MFSFRTPLAATLLLAIAAPAAAQTAVDRLDPVIANPDLTMPAEAPVAEDRVAVEAATADVKTPSLASLTVGSVKVAGARRLTPDSFAPAVMPWLGQTLGPAEMRKLATAVADAARRRGYIFARASIPRQSVADGVLTVELDEGRIDQVQLEGGAGLGLDALFTSLANGEPLHRRQLETVIYTARDRAGLTVGTVRVRREAGRTILVVPVSRKRISAQAYLDNRGTATLGPLRAQLSVDGVDLIGTGDALSLAGSVTPAQPREFGLVSARYARSFGAGGPRIGVSSYFARSRASGALRELGAEGENYEIAVDAVQPLARGRAFSASLTADFAVRRSLLTGDADLEFRRDKVTVASIGIEASGLFAGGAARVEIAVNRGLDLFDASRRDTSALSRPGASGRFTSWTGSAVWARALAPGWILRATGDVQLSDRPLLAGEQFGLGGARLLRGYDYGERLGDEGASAGVELTRTLGRMPLKLDNLEIYAFADGGRVRDKSGAYASSLASAGGGLRMGKGRLRGTLEAAVPLTGPRFDSGDRSPRLSFSLLALF